MFWDHDIKWAINIIGAKELDFRFSVLQPSTGYRYFGEGISHLTKVTGRMQRDVQRYLIAVIAGAAPPPCCPCNALYSGFLLSCSSS